MISAGLQFTRLQGGRKFTECLRTGNLGKTIQLSAQRNDSFFIHSTASVTTTNDHV
jgi:hypothetical protein